MTEKFEIRNDIVCKDGEMVIGEKAIEALRMVKELEEQAKQIKAQADEIKKQFNDAMEENGVENFKSEFLSVARIGETSKLTVDTEKMKADGIYKYYLKETPVKGSVRWTWKKEKANG